MTPTAPVRFTATLALLRVAHELGDYWIQTTEQAAHKQEPGWAGRRACLGHVASYTATSATVLIGGNKKLNLGIAWRGIVAAQAISAATHYFADRGEPLRRLANLAGRVEFYDHGGRLLLDQVFHYVWLAVAAAVAVGATGAPD